MEEAKLPMLLDSGHPLALTAAIAWVHSDAVAIGVRPLLEHLAPTGTVTVVYASSVSSPALALAACPATCPVFPVPTSRDFSRDA